MKDVFDVVLMVLGIGTLFFYGTLFLLGLAEVISDEVVKNKSKIRKTKEFLMEWGMYSFGSLMIVAAIGFVIVLISLIFKK